jgi:hypothetical protein
MNPTILIGTCLGVALMSISATLAHVWADDARRREIDALHAALVECQISRVDDLGALTTDIEILSEDLHAAALLSRGAP